MEKRNGKNKNKNKNLTTRQGGSKSPNLSVQCKPEGPPPRGSRTSQQGDRLSLAEGRSQTASKSPGVRESLARDSVIGRHKFRDPPPCLSWLFSGWRTFSSFSALGSQLPLLVFQGSAQGSSTAESPGTHTVSAHYVSSRAPQRTCLSH